MMTFEKTTDFVVEHTIGGVNVTVLEVLSYVYQKDIREVARYFADVLLKQLKAENPELHSIYDE